MNRISSSGFLYLTLAVLGCGESTPGLGDEEVQALSDGLAQPWSVQGGTLQMSCNGGLPALARPLAGWVDVVVTPGLTLLTTFNDPTLAGCSLEFVRVEGQWSASEKQVCLVEAVLFSGDLVVEKGEIVATAEGAQISLTLSGKGTVPGAAQPWTVNNCLGSALALLGPFQRIGRAQSPAQGLVDAF